MTIIDQTIKEASSNMRAIFAANLAIFGLIISLAIGGDLHQQKGGEKGSISGITKLLAGLIVAVISVEIGYVAYLQSQSEDSDSKKEYEQYGAGAAALFGLGFFTVGMFKKKRWPFFVAGGCYAIALIVYAVSIDGV